MNPEDTGSISDSRASPRFGASEEDTVDRRKVTRRNAEPTFAEIATQIGALSQSVEPSFWLRGLRRRDALYPAAKSVASHESDEDATDDDMSCPSTPTTASMTSNRTRSHEELTQLAAWDTPEAQSSEPIASSQEESFSKSESDSDTQKTSEEASSVTEGESEGSHSDADGSDESENNSTGETHETQSSASSTESIVAETSDLSDNAKMRFGWWQAAEEGFTREISVAESSIATNSDKPSSSTRSNPSRNKGTHSALEKAIRCLLKEFDHNVASKKDLNRGKAILRALDSLLAEECERKAEHTPSALTSSTAISLNEAEAEPKLTDSSRVATASSIDTAEEGISARRRRRKHPHGDPPGVAEKDAAESVGPDQNQHLMATLLKTLTETIQAVSLRAADHVSTGVCTDSATSEAQMESSRQDTTTSSAGTSESLQLQLKLHELSSDAEELRALTQAQAHHLESTLATLEQFDQERTELKQRLQSFQEGDVRKNEFILSLQRQCTQHAEEKQGIKMMLREADATRIRLEAELTEARTVRDLKATELYKKQLEELTTENSQLERDVVDMIQCCKDYRNHIKDLQATIDAQEAKSRGHKSKGLQKTALMEVRNLSPIAEKLYSSRNSAYEQPSSVDEQEVQNLMDRIRSLELERKQLKELLFMAREEKRLVKHEASQRLHDLAEKDAKIEQLEFLLKCEVELSRRSRLAESRLPSRPKSSLAGVSHSRRGVSQSQVSSLSPVAECSDEQSAGVEDFALGNIECDIRSSSPSEAQSPSSSKTETSPKDCSRESVDASTVASSFQDLPHIPSPSEETPPMPAPSQMPSPWGFRHRPFRRTVQLQRKPPLPETMRCAAGFNEYSERNGYATPQFGSNVGSRETSKT